MKRLIAIVCMSALIILVSGYFTTLPGGTTAKKTTSLLRETFTLDTLTIYNPSMSQCDSDPLVTASNMRIDVQKLRQGSIRWMAISRDMLKRWGGRLNYGDTVQLRAEDPAIDGNWVIQDTMNKRFKNRGDLLFDSALRSSGMWTAVTVIKTSAYGSVGE